MKKIVLIIVSAFILISGPVNIFAADEEYYDALSQYDLSFFDSLDEESYSALKQLGLADFDYNKLIDISLSDIVETVKNIIIGKAETPLKACCIVFIIVIISSLFQGMKHTVNDSEMTSLFSTISAAAAAIVLVSKIRLTFSASAAAISVCSDFMYAFIPAFCVIVAASGSTAAAFSTNTLLLSLAQLLNFISKNAFIPFSNCFTAIAVCSGLRSELNIGSLIANLKRYITTAISVCATAFISVLSIKTAVASRADVIGLRSIRFAINSVVPVIGGAISEGLLSIQAYSSLIKSSVGVVGIAAVALIFLPPIIDVAFWRFGCSVMKTVSDVFGDSSVSNVIKAFGDALIIINVVLILSMVTTIISIGILIAARGST